MPFGYGIRPGLLSAISQWAHDNVNEEIASIHKNPVVTNMLRVHVVTCLSQLVEEGAYLGVFPLFFLLFESADGASTAMVGCMNDADFDGIFPYLTFHLGIVKPKFAGSVCAAWGETWN